MNRRGRIDPRAVLVNDLLETQASVPVELVKGDMAFMTAADFGENIGLDPKIVGDLLTRLGVRKSQRRGYRLADIVEAASRVYELVGFDDEPADSPEGRAKRAAAVSILDALKQVPKTGC